MNAMNIGKSNKSIKDVNFLYKTILVRYFRKSISVENKEAGNIYNMHILSGVVLWFQLNYAMKSFSSILSVRICWEEMVHFQRVSKIVSRAKIGTW